VGAFCASTGPAASTGSPAQGAERVVKLSIRIVPETRAPKLGRSGPKPTQAAVPRRGSGPTDSAEEPPFDAHFVKRQRINRLLRLVLDHPDKIGVGADEQTAVVISGTVLKEN